MADGVTGLGNPRANQTTNTGNDSAASPAGAAKFDEILKSLCPNNSGGVGQLGTQGGHNNNSGVGQVG